MRINKWGKAIALLGLLGISYGAMAQPSTLIGSASGSPGDTVTIDLNFVADGTVTQMNFVILYEPSFVIDITGCGEPNSTIDPGDTSCNDPNPGQLNIVHAQLGTTPFGDGTFGSVDLTIPVDTPPGTYPIVFDVESYSNAAGEAVPPDGSVEGQVDVTVSGVGFYDSDPAPGSNLDFGSAVVNSVAGTVNLEISNLSSDTALEISSFAPGVSTGSATIDSTTTFPFSLAAGESAIVDFTCTPESRGDITGTLGITHDGTNTSPQEYPWTCAGLAPNVNVTPATATVSVLAIPGGDSASATYTITNDDDGFTSPANNVDISIAPQVLGVAPTVSVNPTSFASIAAGGSETFDATCDADDTVTEGTYPFDITVTWDDPETGGTDSTVVEFICEVTQAFPVYESNPTPGSTLDFGTVTNGVTSAPLGIDVGNSEGQGPAPESDLNILSATADNAVFTVTLVNDGPFAAGSGPDGTDDIEVTCTPDAIGLVTGTLTVETDDPAEPVDGFTYPLECEGVSDGAFDSDPAPGGTLDLGFAEPGAQTAPGDIDFFNNGDFDDITVSCTLDDPSGSFSQTPDPIDFTIGPGGSETATFQCIPETSDTFTATLTCDIGGDENIDTADYTILCQGQPLVVPTMSTWGLILLSLMLLAVGGYAGRRMLANRA